MTHEETFLQGLIENPDDDEVRLIYAAWLEERGDPIAQTVRAQPETFQLLAGLKTATRAPFGRIDADASAGRVDLLTALAVLLERCRGLIRNPKEPALPQWTLDHLEDVLALTPGTSSVETLLSLLMARPEEPQVYRRFASRLASGQPQGVLLFALEQHADKEIFFELWAGLVQEMVLRGARLAGLPVVEEFREKMRSRGHLLATLPLHLTEIENGLPSCLPHYGYGSSSWGMPFGPSSVPPASPLPLAPDERPLTFSEIADEASNGRIGDAVRNWDEKSNGQVEQRVFRATAALDLGDLSISMLQRLGLASLQGADAGDIRAGLIGPDEAVNIVFSAASNGGAYSSGLLGAYGRLEAWHSLAGLTGAAKGEGVAAIADRAERCLWVSFCAASDWFCQVAWDLGLVALRPDRMSLAVLAATDTD